MKKFGSIAGLGCLAMIGGVFAAWTFGNFSIQQPDPLEFNTIIGDTTIETSFKITAEGEFTDAKYKIVPREGYMADWLEPVLTRTTESGAEHDVNITVKVLPDDEYAVITEKIIEVKASVVLSANDPSKDCLSTLESSESYGEFAANSEVLLLKEKVTMSASHLIDQSLGFKLSDGNVINNWIFRESADVEEYAAALANTKFTYVIELAEPATEEVINATTKKNYPTVKFDEFGEEVYPLLAGYHELPVIVDGVDVAVYFDEARDPFYTEEDAVKHNQNHFKYKRIEVINGGSITFVQFAFGGSTVCNIPDGISIDSTSSIRSCDIQYNSGVIQSFEQGDYELVGALNETTSGDWLVIGSLTVKEGATGDLKAGTYSRAVPSCLIDDGYVCFDRGGVYDIIPDGSTPGGGGN